MLGVPDALSASGSGDWRGAVGPDMSSSSTLVAFDPEGAKVEGLVRSAATRGGVLAACRCGRFRKSLDERVKGGACVRLPV